MTIFLGDQAKRLYYMRDIPLGSIGVFMSHTQEFIYWYCNGYTFDTGFAYTEAEALLIAKRNFK